MSFCREFHNKPFKKKFTLYSSYNKYTTYAIYLGPPVISEKIE